MRPSKKMDTLIAFGSEIKSFEETPDAYKFEGELVVFDSHDVSRERDRFTKSTEFYTEDGETRPVLYHHGLDATMGKAKIGSARVFKRDGAVWVEGEIKKRTDYLETHIEHLAARMKQKVTVKGVEYAPFGLSSGAASHLVERVAVDGGHEIKSWPLSEISITPTPAEPLTSCGSIKSLEAVEDDLKASRGWQTQPRADNGQWTDGAGNLSVSHVHSVLSAEGITETHHHEAFRADINAGILKTREEVLRRIDAIHERRKGNDPNVGTFAPKPELEMRPASELQRPTALTHPRLQGPASSAPTGTVSSRVDAVAKKYGLDEWSTNILRNNASANPNVAKNLEHIGEVANAARHASGEKKVTMAHVFDALDMASGKGGFKEFVAEQLDAEKASNERRKKIGWAPMSHYRADKVRAVQQALTELKGATKSMLDEGLDDIELAPEEAMASGATDELSVKTSLDYEIGRYVKSQLALSGVTLDTNGA